MHLIRLLLVFALSLVLSSTIVLAQQSAGEPWDFSCLKWEERKSSPCGDTPFYLSKKFIIGHSEGTPVGDITIVNRTNRRRTLEYLSLTPAYDGADLLQPYWFTGLPKGITYVGPGKKRVISVFFTGRRKASKSYARRPWVNPGGHDGILKLRDKATGTIYEFNINIRAFQP